MSSSAALPTFQYLSKLSKLYRNSQSWMSSFPNRCDFSFTQSTLYLSNGTVALLLFSSDSQRLESIIITWKKKKPHGRIVKIDFLACLPEIWTQKVSGGVWELAFLTKFPVMLLSSSPSILVNFLRSDNMVYSNHVFPEAPSNCR